jgi:hypothetical protein
MNPLTACDGALSKPNGPPLHGLPNSALTIPANGFVVFARD